MKLYKRMTFDAAHRLAGHEHCGPIHGHTWVVEVWIEAVPQGKWNMIVDFGALEKVVQRLDHKLLLDHQDYRKHPELQSQEVFLLDGAPTCENLCRILIHEFKGLVKNWQSITVRVWESENSYVEQQVTP